MLGLIKSPQTIQLSRLKSVNYRQGFWTKFIKDSILGLRTKIRSLVPANNRLPKVPTPFKRPVIHLKWEHVVIAFLLGMLFMKSSPVHIVRNDFGGFSPAPAIMSVKPLPLLKAPSIKPLGGLDVVWVDKRRPIGTYPNGYAWGNCTEYVASRLSIPNDWGNANSWALSAALAGYTISNQPKVGTIAQTGGDSWAGHVAIVESVNPDGTFVVSEMNYLGLGLTDTRTTSTAEFPNFITP